MMNATPNANINPNVNFQLSTLSPCSPPFSHTYFFFPSISIGHASRRCFLQRAVLPPHVPAMPSMLSRSTDLSKVFIWHAGASCVAIRGEVVVMTLFPKSSIGDSKLRTF